MTHREEEEEEAIKPPVQEEEKIPLTEKIKSMLMKMFEVEDQSIIIDNVKTKNK